MQTNKQRWDVERAAAWLRRRGWGDTGAAPAPQHTAPASPDAGQAEDDDEIEIICWPPLVAPFYD